MRLVRACFLSARRASSAVNFQIARACVRELTAISPRDLIRAAWAVLVTLVAMPTVMLVALAVGGAGAVVERGRPGFVETAIFTLAALLLSGLTVLTATLAAMSALQTRQKRVGGVRNCLQALASLPRLVPSLVAIGLAAYVSFYYWNITSPGLLLAVVGFGARRHQRGVLRRRDALALVLAIPGVAVCAALAVGLALVAQSSTRPGSVHMLWSRAATQLRQHPAASLASWAVAAAASFTVGQLGLRLLDQVRLGSAAGSLHTELGLGALWVILLSATGVVLVVVPAAASAVAWLALDATPTAAPPGTSTAGRAGWLRWRGGTIARTAAVTTLALLASQAYVLATPSAAEANTTSGLLAYVSVSRDLYPATERVPEVTVFVRDEQGAIPPPGTVQFLLDGARLGGPVVTTPGPDGTDMRATISGYTELSYGTHTFGCTFTSTDGTRTQDCTTTDYTARNSSSITVACTPGHWIGDPGTVTATVTSPSDPAGPAPSGTVTIRNETDPVVTFPVVAGTGSHDFQALPDISSVTFTSDTYTDSRTGLDCGRDPQAVTTSSTRTGASLASGPHPLGDPLLMRAVVNAIGSGPDQTPTGELRVTASSTQATAIPLLTTRLPLPVADIPLPTGGLQPGSWTVEVRYVSDSPHYRDSQTTLTVDVARATASLTPDAIAGNPGPFNTSGVWGTPLVAGGSVGSSLDGAVSVQLHSVDAITGAEEVAATQQVTVTAGKGAYSFDLARVFTPRMRLWYLSTTGTALRSEARTATRTLNLGALASVTRLELQPVSGRVDVQIAVGSASATAPAALGSATVYANNQLVGTAAVRDGKAALQYYPRTTAPQDVRVEYAPQFSQGYLPSAVGPITLSGRMAQPVGDPEVTWVQADLDRTTVRLQYRPPVVALGGPAPQATVTIYNGSSRVLASGSPDSGGALTLSFPVAADQLQLYAVYGGDAYYARSTSTLPLVPVMKITPVVALAAPTSVLAGSSFYPVASVAGVPTKLISSVALQDVWIRAATTLTTRISDGMQSDFGLGPVQLGYGTHMVRAAVFFTAASGLPPAYSDLVPVRATLPVPQLVADLRNDQFTQTFTAGRPMTLYVGTSDPANQPSRLNPDSPVRVYDTDGTLLATGTFGAPTSLLGSGPASTIPLALSGGEHDLLIVVGYGPDNALTATVRRSASVEPPPTSLRLEPAPAGVGTATAVDVVLDNHQVNAGVPAGLRGSLTQISAGADPVTTTHPLVFSRDAQGAFRARIILPHPHAGVEQLTAETSATTATGATTAAVSLLVSKRATTLVIAPVSRLASGDAEVRVSASVEQATPSASSPLPTGSIVVSGRLGSCTLAGGGSCTLRDQGFPVGGSVLRVFYPGDADNDTSSANVGLSVDPQRTSLAVHLDPPIDEWVRGTHVRATWRAIASASSARGDVVLRLTGTQDVVCAGAASGSCTFTAPDEGRPVSLRATFTSSTDAPSTQFETAAARLLTCHPVRLPTVDTIVTVSYGRRCAVPTPYGDRAGAGYTDGTALHVAHRGSVPTRYQVDWSTNLPERNYEVLADRSLRLYVSGPTDVTYLPSYAPECVTLRWYPSLDDANRKQGYLYPTTPPNCADPHRPTAADRAGLNAGVVRYAKGTRVAIAVAPGELIREAYNGVGSADRPTFRLVRVNGSAFAPTQPLNPFVRNSFSVLMSADRSLDEVYAVRGCTPVHVLPGHGGEVKITAARRPDSSRGLQPATGACTLPDGRAGYVPGTRLSLVAAPRSAESTLGSFVVPHPDGGFEAVASDGRRTGVRVADLGVQAAPRWLPLGFGGSLEYVVPQPFVDARVGAVFRTVACTPVTFHLAYPAQAQDPWNQGATRYDQVPDLGAQACPGGWPYDQPKKDQVVDETNLIPGKYNSYQQKRVTRWVLSDSVISPSVRPVSVRPGEVGHTPEWSVVGAVGRPASAAVSGYRLPPIDLNGRPQGVEIGLVWRSDICTPLPTSFLKYPNGGKAAVVRYSGDPTCQRASDVAPGTVFAVVGQDRPGFQPYFTSPQGLAGGSNGVRVPRPGTLLFYVPYLSSRSVAPLEVTMSYCRPLSTSSSLVGEDGKAVTRLSPQDAALIRGPGGWNSGPLYELELRSPHCPAGYAEPLSQVQPRLVHGRVDLSQPAAQSGAAERAARQAGTTPSAPADAISAFVDAQGVQTPSMLVTTAHVRCNSVALGKRVVFLTPANCPGGPGRFLQGTTVQVQVHPASDETFNYWNGVDQDFGGGYANVVVGGDRSISADLSTKSIGDKILSGLSGVATSFVAFVSQAASVLVMAEVGILQTVATGASLLAQGLAAVGVDGTALKVLTGIATALNTLATFSQTLGGCVAAWNSGNSPASAAAAALGSASAGVGAAGGGAGAAAWGIKTGNSLAGASVAETTGANLQKGADTLKGIRVGLDLGQAAASSFGGSVDTYTAPPAEKWNGFASSMGSCIESKADATYGQFASP